RGFVPSPDTPLSPVYYADRSRSGSGLFVRADVTYLRQDFSLMQEMAEPKRWPKEQRFDFLVRNRDATAEELAELQKNGGKSDYPQRAAVRFALRELAGP